MADTAISALADAAALDAAEIYPASQGGNSRGVTGAQVRTMVRRAGSASANSWPIFGSGTVLSSPVAGAEEYDGTAEYFSLADSSRSVALAEYFVCLSGTHTLDADTNVHPAFNTPSDTAALTLPAALYFFEALLSLSGMRGTGTTNARFEILGGGNATLGDVLYHAIGVDGATATNAAQSGSMSVQSASPDTIVLGVADANMQVGIRGMFRVTVAGTIVPSIRLGYAIAAVVAVGSYFRCRAVGASNATYCGNWS